MKKLFRKIHNFFFCLKYPFWKVRNAWNGKFLGYSFTWYDAIEIGWQKAFGKQLSKDIKKAGKPFIKQGKKWEDILEFQQIKEKWGKLCLYAYAIDEIEKVLGKYETISEFYCVHCGKPTKYKSHDYWLLYLCEDCFLKTCKHYNFNIKQYTPFTKKEIEDIKKKCKLTKKDIPEVKRYVLEQTFDNKRDFDIAYKKAKREKNVESYNTETVNGKLVYSITYKNSIIEKVDLEKEYDIDFSELTKERE